MIQASFDIIKESRIYYDKDGECWLLLHVPEEVDVGDMGMTLWQSYTNYLKSVDTREPQEEVCPV